VERIERVERRKRRCSSRRPGRAAGRQAGACPKSSDAGPLSQPSSPTLSKSRFGIGTTKVATKVATKCCVRRAFGTGSNYWVSRRWRRCGCHKNRASRRRRCGRECTGTNPGSGPGSTRDVPASNWCRSGSRNNGQSTASPPATAPVCRAIGERNGRASAAGTGSRRRAAPLAIAAAGCAGCGFFRPDAATGGSVPCRPENGSDFARCDRRRRPIGPTNPRRQRGLAGRTPNRRTERRSRPKTARRWGPGGQPV